MLIKNKLKFKPYFDKSQIEKAANVFISSLPSNLQEEELEDLLKDYGNIISVEIKRGENGESLGYGYVQFEKKEEAQKLYQSTGENHTQRNKNNSNVFLRAFCSPISNEINMTDLAIKDYENVWQFLFQQWGQQNQCEF